MSNRNLNHFFKNHAVKALGETRSAKLVFKDLRDSYNETILDSNVNEEIKDTLMGHLRESAKASYSLSIASVVRVYHEMIFPKLAVNGWSLKQKASEVDDLLEAVSDLRTALTQIESENTAYRTRIDNMQNEVDNLKNVYDELEAVNTIFRNKLKLDYPLTAIPTDDEVKEYIKNKRAQN